MPTEEERVRERRGFHGEPASGARGYLTKAEYQWSGGQSAGSLKGKKNAR